MISPHSTHDIPHSTEHPHGTEHPPRYCTHIIQGGFSVNNNLGCCHGNTFVKEHLGKNFSFSLKNGLFLLQNVFTSDFLNQIQNQRLGIDPCTKFQLHWTKDKGTRILTWNDTKNGLMTSYLPPGDDISKIFIAFERFCPRVPSWQVCL